MDDLPGQDKKKGVAPRKRYEIPKTATCHVCGDQAAEHLHYGGIACYSCRAFFRRTVNNTRPVLECSNSNNCKINKDTRKRCQACRFQKCKDIGMKPSWVLSEVEKSRLQDCGRRNSRPGEPVVVKKEEADFSPSMLPLTKIKDERPSSVGQMSDGGFFGRGDTEEEQGTAASFTSHPSVSPGRIKKEVDSGSPPGPSSSGGDPPKQASPSPSSSSSWPPTSGNDHHHLPGPSSGSGRGPSGSGHLRPESGSGPSLPGSDGGRPPLGPASCGQQQQQQQQRLLQAAEARNSYLQHQQLSSGAAVGSSQQQKPDKLLSSSSSPSMGDGQGRVGPVRSSIEQLPVSSQQQLLAGGSRGWEGGRQHPPQWGEHPAFSMNQDYTQRQEYPGRNSNQKESVFPFNKMQVSLSAPGRDPLSFTIETHQSNESSWRPPYGPQSQMGVPGPSNLNQKSVGPHYSNISPGRSDYNNSSSMAASFNSSGAASQYNTLRQSTPITTFGCNLVQSNTYVGGMSQRAQPTSADSHGGVPVTRPSAIASAASGGAPWHRQKNNGDLFEEYLRDLNDTRGGDRTSASGGGGTSSSSVGGTCGGSGGTSVITSPRPAEAGGGGSEDWSGESGQVVKKIKLEQDIEENNFTHNIATSDDRSARVAGMTDDRGLLLSPHHHQNQFGSLCTSPAANSPNLLPQQQVQERTETCSRKSASMDDYLSPLLDQDVGQPNSSSLVPEAKQQPVAHQDQLTQVQQQLPQQLTRVQQLLPQQQLSPVQQLPQQSQSQQSPNQEDSADKSSNIFDFGDLMKNPLSNFQETIFLEQLAAIDDNLKSQVPMDEEHCRAFLMCALTGAKIRQYTILHAYQILIKRIVRLSNSIQDFIELVPGDMHKLLVANTVSMINVRIARWFHPKTSLELQLSLCGSSADLYNEVRLQKDLDPQFEERAIDCEDVFVSPWCCDSNYEDRYFYLINKMHQLPLDSTPLILLSVCLLFNSENVSGLEHMRLIVSNERKFSYLLFRYLQNKYTEDMARTYFNKFVEAKNYLTEMADILINKRLIC